MENKRANFGNRRMNQIQRQDMNIKNPNIQPQFQTISQQQYFPKSNNSNMISIILLILFIIIVYIIYIYGEKIYNYFNTLFSENNNYILLENEEEKKEKIKCKNKCVKGKCENKNIKDDCKEDDECNLCIDNSGGFYGNVPKYNKKENEKLKKVEEEDIIQNKRIIELEEMIKARNKQIDDLNKYIDYVNKNKDKINKEKIKEIISEGEEDKKFILKQNYS